MSNEKRDNEDSLLVDILKEKGLKIVDIYGYISKEFGDPVFKLKRIALSNDKTLDVEGEHDLPYVSDETLLDYNGA